MNAYENKTDYAVLKGEAKIASASAPKGMPCTVRRNGRHGHYDVLFGGYTAGRYLGLAEALACIRGVGGTCFVFKGLAKAAAAAQPIEVIDRFQTDWRKDFKTREEACAWIMEGMAGTEGAEQEHYTNMLLELESGATTLHYN